MHEREDVIDYRKIFLCKIDIFSSTHLPPPLCSDNSTAVETGNLKAEKSIVLISHDESNFHSNDGQTIMWAKEGKVLIHPKYQGHGLMVSDFVTECNGLLQLTDEEYRLAAEANPSIRKYARELIKFGAGNVGYWNSARFLIQMKRATAIADIKFPSNKFSKVWLFNPSSGHCAFKEDALNVNRMNVNVGGAQPRMRDTMWDGRAQRMVLNERCPTKNARYHVGW